MAISPDMLKAIRIHNNIMSFIDTKNKDEKGRATILHQDKLMKEMGNLISLQYSLELPVPGTIEFQQAKEETARMYAATSREDFVFTDLEEYLENVSAPVGFIFIIRKLLQFDRLPIRNLKEVKSFEDFARIFGSLILA